MNLPITHGRIRLWQPGDLASLARHANNPKIARNLRDRFPHPYGEAEAEAWLEFVRTEEPALNFAIEVDGEAAGGCGLLARDDVFRHTMELGYWLGEACWGRGIATEVARRLGDWALVRFPDVERLEAGVFSWNPASARVLEKAGFVREGTRRRAVIKNGEFLDEWVFSRLRGE